MDAKVIIPLAAIGVAGLYIYMKYKSEAEAQRAIIAALQAGTIKPTDVVSVSGGKTTVRIGGKTYTIENTALASAASAGGQALVNALQALWGGREEGRWEIYVDEGGAANRIYVQPGESIADAAKRVGLAGVPLRSAYLGDSTRSARSYALSRGFWKPRTFEPAAWGGAPRNLCIVDSG